MADPLFSWVHLSDIHAGHGDPEHRWDQQLVLEALLGDLEKLPDRPRIDALVVTGDVAFSGAGRSADEYTKAAAWLTKVAAAVKVEPSRVLVVPGNHDVNRGNDKDPGVADVMRRLRDEALTIPIDTILDKPADRALLASRMGAYLDFVGGFGPWTLPAAPTAREDRLYWSYALEGQGGLKLRFVGLNTALLCRDEFDKGKLALGKEQITKALCAAPLVDGELVVVLTHHPLQSGWLKDEGDAHKWVMSRAHLHLSGHVHEAESSNISTGTKGRLTHVVAGAAHMEAMPSSEIPPFHGYNIGSVVRDNDQLVLRVRPRVWSHRDKVFRADFTSVPEGTTAAEHALGATLAAPATHALRLAAPGAQVSRAVVKGPTRIFISHAPEDAAQVAKLEKHLKGLKRDGLIETFTSQALAGGDAEERDRKLASANIVLLMLTDDYVSSDECYDVEMTRAVAAHRERKVRVVPILLEECDIPEQAPFKGLQGLPRVNQPSFKASEDAAFTNVAKELRAVVKELGAGS